VEVHLATPDDVQNRRWRVAWRASLALAGGAIAGIATLLFSLAYDLVPATRQTLADLFALGLRLPLFLGVLWRLAAELLAGLGAWIHGLELQLLGPRGLDTLNGVVAQGVDWIIVLAAATVVGTVGFQVVSSVFAPPSPYRFREPGDRPGRAAPNPPQAAMGRSVSAR